MSARSRSRSPLIEAQSWLFFPISAKSGFPDFLGSWPKRDSPIFRHPGQIGIGKLPAMFVLGQIGIPRFSGVLAKAGFPDFPASWPNRDWETAGYVRPPGAVASVHTSLRQVF
jgi:hypothetical protein